MTAVVSNCGTYLQLLQWKSRWPPVLIRTAKLCSRVLSLMQHPVCSMCKAPQDNGIWCTTANTQFTHSHVFLHCTFFSLFIIEHVCPYLRGAKKSAFSRRLLAFFLRLCEIFCRYGITCTGFFSLSFFGVVFLAFLQQALTCH